LRNTGLNGKLYFARFTALPYLDLLWKADPEGDILLALETEKGVEATPFLDFRYRCFLSLIF